jgi:hypothetical protein
MATRIKDGLSKFEAERDFTSTGDIGVGPATPWKVGAENLLRVVLENVGAGNEVICKGRIRNQSAYSNLLTITGPTVGTTIDISLIDEIYFTCTVYSASGGTPRLIASGFFKKASSDNTTASNLGATGEGVFAQEVGDDLQFKKIEAGPGISVTSNATTITVQATGATTSAPRTVVRFDTDAFTDVGDLVTVTGANFVESISDNLDTTMPNGIFGVAFAKPTATTVDVMFVGIQDGFAGLTTGGVLFVSTSGVPTHTVPATGNIQQIGFAVSTTEIFFYLQQTLRRA